MHGYQPVLAIDIFKATVFSNFEDTLVQGKYRDEIRLTCTYHDNKEYTNLCNR